MTSQVTTRRRRLGLVVAAVAVAAVAACATKVEDPKERQAAAVEAIDAQSARHFHGPVGVVIETVRAHGDLTPDQEKSLRAIQADLELDRAARRELREKFKSSAIAIVRAGTADSPEFDESVSQAAAAIEQRMQKSSDALEEIHLMLSPAQRASVAVALRARIDERFGSRRPDDVRQRRGFQRFAQHLMLSTFQVEQLRAMKQELFADKDELRPSREELVALVDAFEGDEFPSALDEFHAKKSKLIRARFAKLGKRTNAVLALLTPEQRDLLADLIQDGPYKVLLGEKETQAPAK